MTIKLNSREDYQNKGYIVYTSYESIEFNSLTSKEREAHQPKHRMDSRARASSPDDDMLTPQSTPPQYSSRHGPQRTQHTASAAATARYPQGRRQYPCRRADPTQSVYAPASGVRLSRHGLWTPGADVSIALLPASHRLARTGPVDTEPPADSSGLVFWYGVPTPLSLYKILFHFKALLWESIILLLPSPLLQSLPYCNTIARLSRNIRPPTDPPFVCHIPYNTDDGNIV